MIKIEKYSGVWCGQCKPLNPVWIELKNSNPNVEFVSIDVDENAEAVTLNKVKSVPTLIYFKDGIEVFRSTGLVSKDTILKKLNEL